MTLPACMLAIASAGAGHGNYVSAKALFPYSFLFSKLAGSTLTPFFLGLAVVQYPIYGALFGFFVSRRVLTLPLAVVAAHVLAVAICFSGFLPNYS